MLFDSLISMASVYRVQITVAYSRILVRFPTERSLSNELQFVDILELAHIEQKSIDEIYDLSIFGDVGPEVREGQLQDELKFLHQLPQEVKEHLFFEQVLLLFTREVLPVFIESFD